MMTSASAAAPEEFVKPADLFKMRRVSKCKPSPAVQQPSPMKCLNNFAEPSPTKNLPILLKNPFKNQPVKRRLNLGRSPSNSPIKRMNGSCSNHSSPRKSPTKTKRHRMLEMDEDANMEAPRFRQDSNLLTPRKRHQRGPCFANNWALKTKVKVNFPTTCRNWSRDKATTHKRHSGTSLDEDTPSKVNDKTISLEAVRNAATVYQHPYFSWQPLFPRGNSKVSAPSSAGANIISLNRHSEASKMMYNDWCESLDDLVNLLIDGKCSFFYMCSDIHTILFRHHGYQDIQAHISPMHYNFSSELKKLGIKVNCDDDNDIENSQSGFGDVVLSRTCENNGDDDDNEDIDDKEDVSQFLESLGVTVSQQDFPVLQSKYCKNSTNGTADSNSQSTRSTSQRPLATIEGVVDIRKLVKFLQTNRLYTITNVGEFACIPPTLLAPSEFRLSTPRYPDVSVSKNSTGAPPTPPKDSDTKRIKLGGTNNQTSRIDQASSSSTASTTAQTGPKFVEISGTILPNLFKRLHKLLSVSDNMDHTCSATLLDSSSPFKKIPFTTI